MSISQIGSTTEFDNSSVPGGPTVTRNCAAGSMLVMIVSGNAAITTPTGWSLDKHQTCSDAPSYNTNIYSITGVSAGTLSVTIARSGSSGGFRGTIIEYGGMGAATVDKTSGYGFYGSGSGSAFPTTGTLAAAVELAIAGFYAAASLGDTISGPSGWTTVSSGNSPYEYLIASLVTSSTTGLAPYWSTGVNVENTNALVTYKPGPPPAAASLTSPSYSSVTAYTANVTVTSNVTGGLLYAVATQTNTAPLASQIEAGTDRAGFACPHVQGGGASGAVTLALTGLSASTTYYIWWVQDNGSLSNIPTTSLTTLPPPPSITSVDNMSPNYQGSLTINYENGGSSMGTVTIGGVAQTITSWTSLQAVIGSVARGTNKYGVPLDVVVTSAIGSPSVAYSLTKLLPQTGWDYTDMGTPITPDTERISTTPIEIAATDQIAWDTRGSKVLMYPDGSGRIDPTLLSGGSATWNVEAWVSGSGWGTAGTQTVTESSGSGSSFVGAWFGTTGTAIGYAFGTAVSSLSRAF